MMMMMMMIWQMRLVNVVPVVIGARGPVTKKSLKKWMEKLQVDANIGIVQKDYLVGNSAYPKESFRTIRKRSNL